MIPTDIGFRKKKISTNLSILKTEIQMMERLIELPEGELFYDEGAGILKCVWHGFVQEASLKEILLKGAQICLEKKSLHSALLDRRDLDDFSPEAKLYLRQGFLKNEGNSARKYIQKVAILQPKSFGAHAKAKLFSRILRFAFINLPMEVFNDEQKALDWLKIRIQQPKSDDELNTDSGVELKAEGILGKLMSRWRKGKR